MSSPDAQEKPQQQNPKQNGQQGGKKKKKQKNRKKLSKAERMALRAAQQGGGKKKAVEFPSEKETHGDLIRCMSQYQTDRVWVDVKDVNSDYVGKQIWIRGRAHQITGKGKIAFLITRQAFSTIQGVAAEPAQERALVRYLQKQIPAESIVDVFGTVKDVSDNPINKCTQSTVEMQIEKIFCVSKVTAKQLPFSVQDASRSDADIEKSKAEGKKFAGVNTDLRLDYRYIDLRTEANQGIMRIKSGIAKYFREYLTANGFTQIWSPKILGGTSEGGCEVFKVKAVPSYSWGEACLAQSPQLYKQMGVACDLDRVFEIGPVFRAENSLTHRHLAEFIGLDCEMSIKEHYHEFLDVAGGMFNYIFTQIEKNYAKELEAVRRQYPFEPLMWREETLILTFKECMELLRAEKQRLLAEGMKEEDIDIHPDANDFNTRMEKTLGKIVREKYKTDFLIVDKYYKTARPFYTMPDPYDPELTNSYDFLLRGEEITSGAQRIHDPEMLLASAKSHDIPPETIQGYLDCFKYGCPPHAGCGIGLDRVAMLYLGLNNIRKTSMFPRDPKRCTP